MDKPDQSGEDGDPLRYGVTTLPGGQPGSTGPAVLGGQNLAIADGSPDRDSARRLIARITSASANHTLHCGGFVPARKPALTDDCPRTDHSEPSAALERQYLGAVRAAMRHARARPSTPYYGAVTRDIQDVMTRRLEHARGQPPPGAGKFSPEALTSLLKGSLRGR